MDEIDELMVQGFQGNVTTLRTLQLLCRFSIEDAAAFCLVSLVKPEATMAARRTMPEMCFNMPCPDSVHEPAEA